MMYSMETSWSGSEGPSYHGPCCYSNPRINREESALVEAFDTVETEQDRAMMDVSEDAMKQETELDEVDIPKEPIKEAERRAGWRRLPHKVRIAIRRLHRQFGHVPQKVLLNLLRSARVSKEYIDAVKYFRCTDCEETAPRGTGHKTSMSNRYEFNYALGIDVGDLGRRWRQVSGSKHDLFRDMFPTCRSCEKWTWAAHIFEVLRGHQETMDLPGW